MKYHQEQTPLQTHFTGGVFNANNILLFLNWQDAIYAFVLQAQHRKGYSVILDIFCQNIDHV